MISNETIIICRAGHTTVSYTLSRPKHMLLCKYVKAQLATSNCWLEEVHIPKM